MNWYEKKILPHVLGYFMRQKPMLMIRRRWVPAAKGDVLEIGFGAGANLAYYGDAVRTLTAIDPSAELRALAESGLSGFKPDFEFILGQAESMPFENKQFDSLVCTWTLCSTVDMEQVLTEMRRVLKPDGQLIFAEHGLSPDAGVRRWQNRLTPIWRKCAGGCHLNRAPWTMMEQVGFEIIEQHTGYVPGPRPLTFMHSGIAGLA